MIRKLAIGAGVTALAGAMFLGGTPGASAAQVLPTLLSGNPSCEGGLKVEPVADGTFGPVTIDVTGSTFSFTTDGTLVTSVIVKGGPDANLYSYPAPGVTADTGLSAPINPKNGRPYGLSHLCFFLDDGKTPPPPK